MDSIRKQALNEFISSLDIEIKDISLLNLALTHSSYVNEHKEKKLKSNEKLEFLGDAVLGLIISDYLYKLYPDFTEGDLSKVKGRIVSAASLYKKGKEVKIGEYLLLGKGEAISGGRYRSSSVADAFESLIGAIYLDNGIKKTTDFILKYFAEEIDKIRIEKEDKDYKSKLQELTQSKYKCAPVYRVVTEKGPEHKKIFEIEVLMNNGVIGKGSGRSKKEAQQSAAKSALDKMEQKDIKKAQSDKGTQQQR